MKPREAFGRLTTEVGGAPIWFVALSLLLMGAGVLATLTGALAPPEGPPYQDARRDTSAVFIGDSYTAGAGGEGVRWPDLVGREMGWTVDNMAWGGTGYVTSSGESGCGQPYCGTYLEAASEITGEPEYIVVAGGRNDGNTDVTTAATTLFTSLTMRFPDTTVLVILPWYDSREPPRGLLANIAAVRQAAEEVGVLVIDSGQPFADRPELISEDGVHPNAQGYRELAEVLLPLIEDATGTP